MTNVKIFLKINISDQNSVLDQHIYYYYYLLLLLFLHFSYEETKL